MFVTYIAGLKAPKSAPYLFYAFMLDGLQKNKASTKILTEYMDYTNIFFPSLAINLFNNTGINKHAICWNINISRRFYAQ